MICTTTATKALLKQKNDPKIKTNNKTTHHQIHCHYHFGGQSLEKDIRNESLLNLLRWHVMKWLDILMKSPDHCHCLPTTKAFKQFILIICYSKLNKTLLIKKKKRKKKVCLCLWFLSFWSLKHLIKVHLVIKYINLKLK